MIGTLVVNTGRHLFFFMASISTENLARYFYVVLQSKKMYLSVKNPPKFLKKSQRTIKKDFNFLPTAKYAKSYSNVTLFEDSPLPDFLNNDSTQNHK